MKVKEIAKMLNLTQQTIRYRMKELNIKTRNEYIHPTSVKKIIEFNKLPVVYVTLIENYYIFESKMNY